ncbi:MAG: ATP-binding protein [Acidimicrobiales bacterium]
MLVGRDREMAQLQKLWADACEGKPQLGVMYGRRRVGKTFLCVALLDELRRDRHRVVYFNATEESEGIQLRRLADAMRRDLGSEATAPLQESFSSWESALEYLLVSSRQQPLAVVIDEVSWLTESTPAFASIVQSVWDRATTFGPAARLLLLLTGSAIGALTRLLSAGGPLFRRARLQQRLDPLNVREAARLLPGANPEAVIQAYAACGGIPLYLSAWDTSASAGQNLEALAGSPGGILLEDAPSVVRDEIGGEVGFGRVLAAIGTGITRRGAIADATAQRIETSLDVLQASGLVRRATPLGAPRRATPFYEVPDPYLRFWYSVLFRNVGLIAGGQGRVVLARESSQIDRHVAWVWEELARWHAVAEVGHRLPPELLIGRWWDHHGQDEIDVLGLDGSRTALVGEARWSVRTVEPRDVARLLAKAGRTPGFVGTPQVAIWSKAGITPTVAGAGVQAFGPGDVVG